MKTSRLDVLIATYGAAGINRVAQMSLPVVEGVRYLVSWQLGDSLDDVCPAQLNRDDIEVRTSTTRGLSRNRNLLLQMAQAPVCLIADDDLRYTANQLQSVMQAFEAHPDVEMAAFKYDNQSKFYPIQEMDISKRTAPGHNISSIEIAFRLEAIKGKIWFNEDFGIGSSLACGEDGVFVCDCRKAGLKCRYFPIEICRHIGVNTGQRPMTPAMARGEGAYIRYAYGWKGLPRVPLNALRQWRKKRISLLVSLFYYLQGWVK